MDLESQVADYWDRRAETYHEMRRGHLSGSNFTIWRDELLHQLPTDRMLKILDVGTSDGYMAIVAASLGHQITGIDVSSRMLEYARKSAQEYQLSIDFLQMDAHCMTFKNETFDAIITRNTTWTRIDVRKVYREFYRVLKPGGILLNYDADFGKTVFWSSDMDKKNPSLARLYKECDEIKEQLSISYVLRPQWDVAVLRNCGFIHCEADQVIGRRFQPHGAVRKTPKTPMFSIYALKASQPENGQEDKLEQLYNDHIYLRKQEERFYQQVFARLGILDTHFYVLHLLYQHREGLRPSDISEYLVIPRQTMTRVISALTEQELICSKVNPHDKRSFDLFLTEKGISYIQDVVQEISIFWQPALQQMDPVQFREFNDYYRNYLDTLSTLSEHSRL